ncbi:MAG TPA: FKBP-type peptidyl-prolyl cis-trans isomerase [Bacteroidales bacterium]|nr:FKBP-type peptidyl-prolyl cis-trans isomerase [Bacteroidales bacterium]
MYKKIITILVIITLLVACKNDKLKFNKHESGLEYKIIEKGNTGIKIKQNDLLELVLSYQTEDGKVLFNSAESDRKYLKKVSKPTHSGGSFEDGLLLLSVGDSAVFKINGDSFLRYSMLYSKIPKEIGLDDYVIVNVRVLDLVGHEEYDEILSDRFHESEEVEMEILANYIKNANINTMPKESGLYYIETQKGTGVQAEPGKRVSVHYTLTLIDGQFIETSLDKAPFTFTLGQNQVIPAWEEGICYMKEGAKATLIAPSKLAYGNQKIENILPYSTLIFEVELIKVY